jgi:tetratricopeptide (TPR) repeat protein
LAARNVLLSVFASVAFASALPAQTSNRPHDDLGKITVNTSPALFATMAVLDQCGFESDDAGYDALRQTIHSKVEERVRASQAAQQAVAQACSAVRDHALPDHSQDLAQYISLALNLDGPPFALKRKEADLPPDAANVVSFVQALQQVESTAGLSNLWQQVVPVYETRLQALHEPLSKMLFATDLYLRLPLSSYLGREFVIYIDPQLPPGLVNARNYSDDYYVALSPARAASHMDEIRHTYLHYILDPLILKRANAIKKIQPLMPVVQKAPMPDNYKRDASLLVIESLIRAIEARLYTAPGTDAKKLELERAAHAKAAVEQGFVLSQYFYDELTRFEKDTVGIRDAIADMLYNIDVEREKKRASQVTFASSSIGGEVLAQSSLPQQSVSQLDLAEQKLATNDIAGARQIAQAVLDQKTPGEDQGRALFVLARVAVLSRNVPDAEAMFERALEVSKDPRVLAWSHISLGRIFDLKCVRPQAISHYKAAIETHTTDQQAQAAAQQGLQSPGRSQCDSEKGSNQ